MLYIWVPGRKATERQRLTAPGHTAKQGRATQSGNQAGPRRIPAATQYPRGYTSGPPALPPVAWLPLPAAPMALTPHTRAAPHHPPPQHTAVAAVRSGYTVPPGGVLGGRGGGHFVHPTTP